MISRNEAQRRAHLAIKNEQCLIKIIQATHGDDTHWDFILNQIADPKRVRPFHVHAREARERVFDPTTGNYVRRKVGQQGAAKETNYTKKTATSILPADGKMRTYAIRHGIGLLLDELHCDTRAGKYVFPENANTDSRWWLGNYNGNLKRRSVSIRKVREDQRAAMRSGQILSHNEALARLSLQSVVGVFAPVDDLITRLNTLRITRKAEEKLKKKLAILIITPDGGVRDYTTLQQYLDLHAGLSRSDLTRGIIRSIPGWRDDILNAIYFPEILAGSIANIVNLIDKLIERKAFVELGHFFAALQAYNPMPVFDEEILTAVVDKLLSEEQWFLLHQLLSIYPEFKFTQINERGNSIFHRLAGCKQVELLERICKNANGITVINASEFTPFDYAIARNNLLAVQVMLKYARGGISDVSAAKTFFWLIMQCHFEQAQRMTELWHHVSSKFNSCDRNKALLKSIECGQFDLAEYILNESQVLADDMNWHEATRSALAAGQYALAEALVRRNQGLNSNTKNSQNETLIAMLVRYEQTDTLAWLIQNKAQHFNYADLLCAAGHLIGQDYDLNWLDTLRLSIEQKRRFAFIFIYQAIAAVKTIPALMTLMQVLEQSNVDYLKPPREASHFGLRLWNHHPCSESWSLLIKHAKNTVLKLAQLGDQTRTPEVINFLNAKREKSLVSETTSLKLFRQAQQNSVAFACDLGRQTAKVDERAYSKYEFKPL